MTPFGARLRSLREARGVGLAELARAWHDWAAQDDAWFVVVHGEVLARR